MMTVHRGGASVVAACPQSETKTRVGREEGDPESSQPDKYGGSSAPRRGLVLRACGLARAGFAAGAS
jgi:hypothetical protein